MKITIEYLIKQPYMNNVKVLCAENRLRNVVDGISFLEGNINRLMLLKSSHIAFDSSLPLKGPSYYLALTLKRVLIFFHTQFIQHYVRLLLFLYILLYDGFIQSNHTHIIHL